MVLSGDCPCSFPGDGIMMCILCHNLYEKDVHCCFRFVCSAKARSQHRMSTISNPNLTDMRYACRPSIKESIRRQVE